MFRSVHPYLCSQFANSSYQPTVEEMLFHYQLGLLVPNIGPGLEGKLARALLQFRVALIEGASTSQTSRYSRPVTGSCADYYVLGR